MTLKTLYLKDFRNYEEATFEFAPGVNAILGDNAQGKTNVLEALHFLVAGRSFRTHHLSDLVRFGAKTFHIEALFESQGIEQTLKIACDGKQRNVFLNTTPLPSLSALLGIIPGVILHPEDAALVKGGPAVRRRFLDIQIAQADPLYLHHLSRYVRACKQRNHLLRHQETNTLDIWEEEMATSAAYLIPKRLETVRAIEVEAAPLLADPLTLRYKSSALGEHDIAAFYRTQYAENRERELERGSTLAGPHKDDVIIEIGGKEARLFGSEGQQRSSVAALRLAEWKRLASELKTLPFMSVDDIGLSLDRTRETDLFSYLGTLGQVFLTSPRKDLPLPAGSALHHVANGSILRNRSFETPFSNAT